jgi:hypothetical protein
LRLQIAMPANTDAKACAIPGCVASQSIKASYKYIKRRMPIDGLHTRLR